MSAPEVGDRITGTCVVRPGVLRTGVVLEVRPPVPGSRQDWPRYRLDLGDGWECIVRLLPRTTRRTDRSP